METRRTGPSLLRRGPSRSGGRRRRAGDPAVRACVAVADNPLGPFKQPVKESLIPDEYSIDSSLFIDDGIRNVATASEMGIRTFCPENGADWTKEIYDYIKL